MKKIKQHFNIVNDEKYSIKEVIVLSLLISLLLSVVSSFIVYKVYVYNNSNDINRTYNKIISAYLDEVDQDALSDAAIKGMMDFLGEKYSIYMDTNETNDLYNHLDGSYKGMGISIIRTEDSFMKIYDVYDNTPAQVSGLKKDDIIKSIDNIEVNTITNDELTNFLKTKESVKIKIIRNNEEKEIIVNVKTIETPVVKSEIFTRGDKKIGYIYLSSFSKNSYKQVKNSLKKLEKNNIDSLIFDVRSNTGGYLSSVTDILEIFIRKGKVLYQIEDKKEKTDYISKEYSYKEYPVYVLVDYGSASASEIFATSMKENYGSIIIGTNTYGKGKVQQTMPLKTSGMVKYTTANWYTPKGNSINEIGITPGIYVELTSEYLKNPCYETDNQLNKALDIINEDY